MSSAQAEQYPVVIIGAGPAGLTAACELVRHGVLPLVLEKGEWVGGLARTETYKGFRFDIGGHRFCTQVDEIARLREMLGEDFIQVPRLSRIFYRGRFFNYPIELFNTLYNLGIIESALTLLSYLGAKLFPYPREETFEEWVSNRFGRRLFRAFFKTYTEKVWGIPCDVIQADWAAQRIRGLSLAAAVSDALFRNGAIKTLIKNFDYPRYGPGMMWEAFARAIARGGGRVELGWRVTRAHREDARVTHLVAQREDGTLREIRGTHFLSTMPITELVQCLDPPAPNEVMRAAAQLHYRAFILVALIVKRAHLFPDNWIYVHSPDVRVGRIQNFKNWSAAMVPDARMMWMRELSVRLDVATVWCAYGAARVLWDDARFALLIATLVSFHPLFMFFTSVVNNAAREYLCFGALVWVMAIIARRGMTLRRGVMLGSVLAGDNQIALKIFRRVSLYEMIERLNIVQSIFRNAWLFWGLVCVNGVGVVWRAAVLRQTAIDNL